MNELADKRLTYSNYNPAHFFTIDRCEKDIRFSDKFSKIKLITLYINIKCFFVPVSFLNQLAVVLYFAKLSFRILTSLLRVDTICNKSETCPSNSLRSPEM